MRQSLIASAEAYPITGIIAVPGGFASSALRRDMVTQAELERLKQQWRAEWEQEPPDPGWRRVRLDGIGSAALGFWPAAFAEPAGDFTCVENDLGPSLP